MNEEDEQLENPKNLKYPLFMLILDGWGIGPDYEHNAITASTTRNINKLISSYPTIALNVDSTAHSLEDRYYQLGVGRKHCLEGAESLSKVITQQGFRQLHCATPERFNFLTYSFNGHRTEPLHNTEWKLITDIITTKPEEEIDLYFSKFFPYLLKSWESKNFDVIIAALPNLAIMAETAHQESTMKTFELLDKYIGRLSTSVLNKQGVFCITSTHGIAERMVDKNTDLPNKKRTLSPVPFIMCHNELEGMSIQSNQTIYGNDLSLLEPLGTLIDIPTTLLHFLELPIPDSMMGRNLFGLDEI